MAKCDSCGGIIECTAEGLPAGLGEPVFDKLDALLAQAVMSVGAVKGVEIGDGFAAAASSGSLNNDPFYMDGGTVRKRTNHSGGTLGGMSDGSRLILRAAVKPTASIAQPQRTVNESGEDVEITIRGRHDPVIVPRAVVVIESMTAITLADLLLQNMTSRIDKIRAFYTYGDEDVYKRQGGKNQAHWPYLRWSPSSCASLRYRTLFSRSSGSLSRCM